jgi:hypothetical protein
MLSISLTSHVKDTELMSLHVVIFHPAYMLVPLINSFRYLYSTSLRLVLVNY